VFDENFQVYGVRKIWKQMKREGFDVARCTVARLMKAMGLQGVIRGKPHRTTISDKAAPCPLDLVNRDFKAPAPNRLLKPGPTTARPLQDSRVEKEVVCGRLKEVRQSLRHPSTQTMWTLLVQATTYGGLSFR
jgi:transposase InsO family protein